MRNSLVRAMRWVFVPATAVLAGATVVMVSCVTPATPVEYGIQSGFDGFVPGRIAVMGCRAWPAAGVLSVWPRSDMAPAQVADFCGRVDAFVLDGFKDQPFMKGVSPAGVERLLAKAGRQDLPSQIEQLWRHRDGDCLSCAHPGAFYDMSILPRPEWRAWLGDFGSVAGNSDAVLIPWLLYLAEERINDRGLLVARRRVGVALFLYSSTSGRVIWSGGYEGVGQNQSLDRGGAAPEFPSWDLAWRSWTAGPVWRDFPGRQIRE